MTGGQYRSERGLGHFGPAWPGQERPAAGIAGSGTIEKDRRRRRRCWAVRRSELSLSPHDLEVLSHYDRFMGSSISDIFVLAQVPVDGIKPIYVLEYSPPSDEYDWVYLTVGMSRLPMAAPAQISDPRAELMAYSDRRYEELVDSLAGIAAYPFLHRTFLAQGHTIHGRDGQGIVAGSPLTDVYLTRPYYAEEGFEVIAHGDGTHTHVFWLIPIYPSERVFAAERGWKALEALFVEKDAPTSNLMRAPVA